MASLPKKLTVIFAGRGTDGRLQVVLLCERAYLAGESDIRAWGQQIGGQMSGDRQLNFQPDIQQRDCGVETPAGSGAFKHYQVLFVLNSMPDWGGVDKKNNSELQAKAAAVVVAVSNPRAPQCVHWRQEGPFKPLEPLVAAPRVLVEEDQIRLNQPLGNPVGV